MKIINTKSGEEPKSSSWLTIGKVYNILSIYVFKNKGIYFRMVSDDGPSPVIFDARQFRIISHNIPSNWVIDSKDLENIRIAPQKWLRTGFWEDFFDNQLDAMRDFEDEQRTILSENSMS